MCRGFLDRWRGARKTVVRLVGSWGGAVPVSARLHKLMEVAPLNHIALDENEEALDDVVQLADIPPPVVPLQPLDRLFREVLRRKAVALGHPLGCTGAKLTATLLHEMIRREVRYGICTMCVGGGMGAAGVVENLRL